MRGQSCREAALVFLDWGIRSFFNENISREKRLRDNILTERSQRGKSHNRALTMQWPILVFFKVTNLL